MKTLVVKPNVFIWSGKNEVLIYNSLNYQKVILPLTDKMKSIVSHLSDYHNMYRISFSQEELEDNGINSFVSKLVSTDSANLCDKEDEKAVKSYMPMLRVQNSGDYFTYVHQQGNDKEIINNLRRLVIHINGSSYGDANLEHQFTYPVSSREILSLEKITKLYSQAKQSFSFNKIVLVGDLSSYSDFDFLIQYLSKDFNPVCVYCIDKDFITYLSNHTVSKDIEYHILFTTTSIPEELKPIISLPNVISEFVLYSEENYQLIAQLIEDYSLKNANMTPAFNGSNIDFFKDNVFSSLEEIEQLKITKREICIHQNINIFSFGRLIVYPNGDIYANSNLSKLGNVDDELVDIIYKELTSRDAWLDIRDRGECSDCAYRWLCSSPSNYEKVMEIDHICNLV